MDRDAFVAAHGGFAYNLKLDDEEWTVGEDLVGMGEQRIAAVAQLATDVLGTVRDATVLDLGCHEGGFGLELAARGAQVTFVEGRSDHLAHASFVAESLGLTDRTRFVEADVRSVELPEPFDVVLCLGLMYHLPGSDLVPFAQSLRHACRRLLICETQVAKRGRQVVSRDGDRAYRGIFYRERVSDPGASIDGESSAWLTRPSLANLLSTAGFTTVTEVLMPRAEASYRLDDHVVLLAWPGVQQDVRVVPPGAANAVRMPEGPPRFTHNAQGFRWRLRNRLAGSGKNFWATLWRKQLTPPQAD